jgi:hypothetical protein
MNEKPTVKDFYNEELKEAYDKVFKVLDGDKKLAKYFFDYNPDIKTAKKGLESRAVEWALANREYWGTKAHPTLSKASTVSEAEGKEMISARRKKAVASRLLPALKKKVAETKARKEAEEAEEKAKPKPAPTKAKPKAKKEKKTEAEDEDELLRVATELAQADKGSTQEKQKEEFKRIFKIYAPADAFGLLDKNTRFSPKPPAEIKKDILDQLDIDDDATRADHTKLVRGVARTMAEKRPEVKKLFAPSIADLWAIYREELVKVDPKRLSTLPEGTTMRVF